MRATCVVCVAALALTGAASRHAESIKTVAVSPLDVPDGLDNPEPVQALFDSLITSELARAGLSVISSREVGAVWRRLVDSVHGFYSPITGERMSEKYAAVRNGTLRELKERLHADAWLRPRIQVVPVDYTGGKAYWDGASEGVGSGTSGTVAALTLVVAVSDTTGSDIYIGRGGIQVLRKGGKEVSRDKLFRDAKRNLQALHLAIDSLIARAVR
ncbi:MAG TPA: hypothetical protein VFI66_07370 [Gemmatimonadales bacterium]|nr:hypothetical protein [Gemmatimonadales bacterium]